MASAQAQSKYRCNPSARVTFVPSLAHVSSSRATIVPNFFTRQHPNRLNEPEFVIVGNLLRRQTHASNGQYVAPIEP